MSKRISKQLNSFKYKGEPIKITLGTLLLTCLCVLYKKIYNLPHKRRDFFMMTYSRKELKTAGKNDLNG